MEDGMPEAPSDEGDLAKRVTDLEAQLEEILNMLKTITETTQATQTNQEKVFSEFNKIKDEPGDEPVKVVKKGFDEYSSKKVNSRRNMAEIEELRKLIGERQKNNNNLL
jgi:flagellin-like hook-associated protein FlgL